MCLGIVVAIGLGGIMICTTGFRFLGLVNFENIITDTRTCVMYPTGWPPVAGRLFQEYGINKK